MLSSFETEGLLELVLLLFDTSFIPFLQKEKVNSGDVQMLQELDPSQ